MDKLLKNLSKQMKELSKTLNDVSIQIDNHVLSSPGKVLEHRTHKKNDLIQKLRTELKDEPILLSGKRVNELLDIGTTTRFYLLKEGLLEKIKLGNKMQSQAKYTKESVIQLIAQWQLSELE